jgi:hypothetical protein
MPETMERAPVDMANRFKVVTYLSKAVVDDKGEWWLVGIASGPRLDRQNERCSPRALEMMRQAIVSGQIPLRKSHMGDWDEEMGFLREGTIDPAGDLEIRVWLDKEMDYCQTLKRRIDGDPAKGVAPRKLGLSMGGRVTEWFLEPGPGGSQVRVLDAVELDHVCVTSCPAYPGAMIDGLEVKQKQYARRWVSDIAKAVNWNRAANPEGNHATPEAEGTEPGETEMSILNKADPPTPPEQDPPSSEDKPVDEQWKDGRWCGVKQVTGDDNVWVKNTQNPPPSADVQPPAPEQGAKDMTDEQAAKILEALDATNKKLDALAKTNEDLVAANDALKGERRGIHADGTGAPPATIGNYIEALKSTEAYQAASPGVRRGMLDAAMQKAGTSR